MKKLLHRTLLQFIACATAVFLLTMPAFYLITKHYYAEDLLDLIDAVERGEGIPHLDIEEDVMKGVMIQFCLIFVVLSATMLITLRIISRRLWHPFDDTLAKMERFNLEQGTEPQFIPTTITEFSRLNRAVGQLISRSRESYLSQKEFTENASHELQTPLAIAQSKLDLLLQEDLDEAQAAIVGDLYRIYSRMSHLNKNLLLLARIENAQYADMTCIYLAPFIKSQLPHFESLQGGDVTITYRTTDPQLSIRANDILFGSLLNNLVVNAIRHTPPGRSISIETQSRSLTVSNAAAGGPLDEKTLFCRFRFTDDRRRGNGLGLAIVKAICDFHGWQITYAFTAGCHRFKIVFGRM